MPRPSSNDGSSSYDLRRLRRLTVAISIDRAYNICMSTILTTLLVVTLGLAVGLWLLALLGR